VAETVEALKTLNPSGHFVFVIDPLNFSVPGILNSIRRSLRRLTGQRGPAPGAEKPELTGAPARMRVKTYSSESGYVYLYVYRGQRADEGGTSFVFSLNREAGRRQVEIFAGTEAIREWERKDGRTLRTTEIYGVAKLAFFEFLDREDAWEQQTPVSLTATDIERHLGTLGLL
jgi:hypothetical protein